MRRSVHIRRHSKIALLALAAAMVASSPAQSINVDLDIGFGNAQNGNGEPPPSFGAASGQTGSWNRVSCVASGPITLMGLDGLATSVVYTVPAGSGLGGGSNLPINTGPFALLLNDYATVPDLIVFRFSGMLPGRYTVFTYAIDAGLATRVAEVSVTDSITPNPQLSGQGAMPGNAFVLGVTHCVHEVDLRSSVMEITVRNRVQGPPNASVNGFQIIQTVPEPASLLMCSAGLLALVARRRRGV